MRVAGNSGKMFTVVRQQRRRILQKATSSQHRLTATECTRRSCQTILIQKDTLVASDILVLGKMEDEEMDSNPS